MPTLQLYHYGNVVTKSLIYFKEINCTLIIFLNQLFIKNKHNIPHFMRIGSRVTFPKNKKGEQNWNRELNWLISHISQCYTAFYIIDHVFLTQVLIYVMVVLDNIRPLKKSVPLENINCFKITPPFGFPVNFTMTFRLFNIILHWTALKIHIFPSNFDISPPRNSTIFNQTPGIFYWYPWKRSSRFFFSGKAHC